MTNRQGGLCQLNNMKLKFEVLYGNGELMMHDCVRVEMLSYMRVKQT
jgi:hypothetical protein